MITRSKQHGYRFATLVKITVIFQIRRRYFINVHIVYERNSNFRSRYCIETHNPFSFKSVIMYIYLFINMSPSVIDHRVGLEPVATRCKYSDGGFTYKSVNGVC